MEVNACGQEGFLHHVVLGFKATDLTFVRCHGRLQVFGLLGGELSMTFLGCWDIVPISLGFLGVLTEPFFLCRGEHLIESSQVLHRREAFVCAGPVLEVDTINLRGSSCNMHLLCIRGLEGLLKV